MFGLLPKSHNKIIRSIPPQATHTPYHISPDEPGNMLAKP
jgi:hypothetical protein